ncbi:Cell division protein FtsK [Klebsiella pneumoniae IS43]|uniref:Cell division protein FtsK n=1 Tax=Klebsiella pneumoniae IS43 TaxID=1432552 RepID=W1DNA7_KLEPN|nr:Cell division protein FtsK [Klebsiella pneumoniae IS43]
MACRYPLFHFGVMAYTIPVIIIGGCWFAWRHQEKRRIH